MRFSHLEDSRVVVLPASDICGGRIAFPNGIVELCDRVYDTLNADALFAQPDTPDTTPRLGPDLGEVDPVPFILGELLGPVLHDRMHFDLVDLTGDDDDELDMLLDQI